MGEPSMLHNDRTWVSLVGPFMGKYAQIPGAASDIEARLICNATNGLKHIWCTTYSYTEVLKCIEKYGGEIVTINGDSLEGWDLVYEERDAYRREREQA